MRPLGKGETDPEKKNSKLNAFLLFVSTPLLETSTGQGPIGIAGVTHLISDDDM